MILGASLNIVPKPKAPSPKPVGINPKILSLIPPKDEKKSDSVTLLYSASFPMDPKVVKAVKSNNFEDEPVEIPAYSAILETIG